MTTPKCTCTNDLGRLWVRLISKRAFRQYVTFKKLTNEELAEAATEILRDQGHNTKCSVSTVAFLRSEKKSARMTCRPETASAIEKALGAPPGSLFAIEVLAASPSIKRTA